MPYVPAPGESGPCNDPTCRDVCVIKTCDGKNEHQVIQRIADRQKKLLEVTTRNQPIVY